MNRGFIYRVQSVYKPKMKMPDRKELLLRNHPDKGFTTPGVVIAGLPWQTVDGTIFIASNTPGDVVVNGETVCVLDKSDVPASLVSYYNANHEPVSMDALYRYAIGQLGETVIDSDCKVVYRCVTAEEAAAGDALMVSWNRKGVMGPELLEQELHVDWNKGLPHKEVYSGLGHFGGNLMVEFVGDSKTLLCPSTYTTPLQASLRIESVNEALHGLDVTVVVPRVGRFTQHIRGVCEPGHSRELRLGDRRMWLNFVS